MKKTRAFKYRSNHQLGKQLITKLITLELAFTRKSRCRKPWSMPLWTLVQFFIFQSPLPQKCNHTKCLWVGCAAGDKDGLMQNWILKQWNPWSRVRWGQQNKKKNMNNALLHHDDNCESCLASTRITLFPFLSSMCATVEPPLTATSLQRPFFFSWRRTAMRSFLL